jgi:type I restriction enzyme M protein
MLNSSVLWNLANAVKLVRIARAERVPIVFLNQWSTVSEDLVQSASHPLGRYEYIRLGSTSLKQLRTSRYIRTALQPDETGRKPDGIVFLATGGIKAVVEVKQPNELTAAKLPGVVATYSPIARAVCNLLIITDGKKSYWINPHTENPVMQNGLPVREEFFPKDVEGRTLTAEAASKISNLIEHADQTLTADNDLLGEVSIVDPSQLARKVWQKIWVTTGKDPEKCLYNVVEIFLFKFLSDNNVLSGNYSFRRIVELLLDSPEEALNHYASVSRKRIKTLFPKGDDGTTVINGTIFVNEAGEPNYAQSALFAEVVRDFQDFDNTYGSMRNINREFKTRLYESFLRQQAGIKSLGQYFTPRSIVRSIVTMSNAGELPADARICDPFCGVGGFLLETIVENPSTIQAQYEPVNGAVRPQVHIRGYDKGTDEKDDERTIILAKANMLIYFSDLLGLYHSEEHLKQFAANAFNDVFKLIRTNLGTFGLVNDEPYDLILTNPPYVTSGSKSLRNAIDAAGLADYYPALGHGTEALAIQWIVKNLKLGGHAFVVVPDGLLNQTKVLEYIKANCIVNAVIALPSRTFYSTPKKTYILALSRKRQASDVQSTGVFTYLISEIGESRDARRIAIDRNDLPRMVSGYRQFSADKANYSTSDPRSKVTSWADFDDATQWLIDRSWTKEERIALGIDDEQTEVDEDTFRELVQGAVKDLNDYLEALNSDA